jgi:hypothetical protein
MNWWFVGWTVVPESGGGEVQFGVPYWLVGDDGQVLEASSACPLEDVVVFCRDELRDGGKFDRGPLRPMGHDPRRDDLVAQEQVRWNGKK